MNDTLQTVKVEQAAAQPAAQSRIPRPVTREQRWLLLAALIVGVAFRAMLIEASATWSGWYGVFWLVAMAAVTPFIGRRVWKHPTAIAIGAAAVALCVLSMVRADANYDVNWLLLPAIPVTMMLYLVFGAYDIPVKREGEAARLSLCGVSVYAFSGVPAFCYALFSLFRGRERSVWRRVLAGAAIGVPLAVAVTALLSSADTGMARLFDGLLSALRFETWLSALVWILFTAMLFYGVFERAIRPDKPALPAPAPASWPAVTMAVLLIPVLLVYAVFVCLQFSYLFGGALPETLTYSAYAREGFTQLNAVAGINFTLLGLTLRYAKKHRLLTVLCALLLLATAGVIASCIARLLLYIGAYGLTMLRILPLWFAVFLAAMTVLSAVRLICARLPVLRIGGIAFIYWFVLLQLPDWNAIIAAYNALHGMG